MYMWELVCGQVANNNNKSVFYSNQYNILAKFFLLPYVFLGAYVFFQFFSRTEPEKKYFSVDAFHVQQQ